MQQATTIHVGSTPKSLSFSGCGFLGVYHIGVASCFKHHAPKLLANMDRIYGCSAGSIMGAMLLNDVCFGEVCRSTLQIVKAARSRYLGPLSPGFKLNSMLMEGFRRGLPPNAHKRASGKLFISLTRLRDGKNVIVSEYNSRQELMDVLICSSFVPFYSGIIPPTYRGVYYVDGGLSNNLPADEDTITVSPWSGGSDICPKSDGADSLLDLSIVNTSIQLTAANMHRCSTMFFPSKAEELHDFCRQGYREALQYLREHGLFETTNPRPRSMSFSVLHDLNCARRETRISMSQSNENSIKEDEQWEYDIEQNSSRELYDEYISSDDVIDISADSGLSENGSECDESEIFPSTPSSFASGIKPPITVVGLYPSQESSIVLQFNLPPPVIEALESFYSTYNKPTWKQPIGKLISICKKYNFAIRIPLDRAYLLACIVLNKLHNIPDAIKNHLQYLSSVVEWLQNTFSCRGEKLAKLLNEYKDQDVLQSLSYYFSATLQVILIYLSQFNSYFNRTIVN